MKAGSVIPLSHRLLSRHPRADYALRMVGCALLHRPQKPTSSPSPDIDPRVDFAAALVKVAQSGLVDMVQAAPAAQDRSRP